MDILKLLDDEIPVITLTEVHNEELSDEPIDYNDLDLTKIATELGRGHIIV